MYIPETNGEIDTLTKLCYDKDEKIAFLAKYIRKILNAAEDEESHKAEQNERNA